MIKNMRRWLADMIYPEGSDHRNRLYMGMGGPELITPLVRGPDGKLGVCVWTQGCGDGPYAGSGGGGR